MGLFEKKNKKNDQFKSLSEVDIQKKLYGNIQPNQKTDNTSPVELRPKAPQPVSRPVQVQSTPDPETSYREDLFSSKTVIQEPSQSSEPTPTVPPVVKTDETVRDQQRMERLASLRAADENLAQTITSSPKTQPVREKSIKPERPQPAAVVKPRKDWLKPVVSKAGAGAVYVLSQLANIVFWFGKVLARVVRVVDLRRPTVRNTLYWILGIVVLVSLFFAIHLLNVRREAAMKAPRKPVVPVEQPVEEAAQAAVVEERSVDSTEGAQSEERPVTAVDADAQEPEAVQTPQSEIPEAVAQATGDGRYVLQIATYAGPNDAGRVTRELRAEGFSAFIKELHRPSGRIFYSVFIGRFETFQDTQQFFAQFRKSDAAGPFQDAFIRTLEV